MARYFIALLLPEPLKYKVTQIQQHFAQQYASCKALNSPPHITLQPPFEQVPEQTELLAQTLQVFAEEFSPVPVCLSGFGAFSSRVIYLNVLSTFELVRLQSELTTTLAQILGSRHPKVEQRRYVPHVTVAFRDLTPANFAASWSIWQKQPFKANFVAPALGLLKHNGQLWLTEAEFPFSGNSATDQAIRTI